MTLQDVADRAGVSRMTVSNFINDKFQFMSPATRQRVAAAVTDLNYRPDTAGRSLRSARHKSIGMIVVDESPNFLSLPSTSQVVSGFGNALNDAGYTLQLEGLRASEFEQSSLLRLVRTDGVCLMLSGALTRRRAMLSAMERLNQPLVALYERAANGISDLCCIGQNDRQGGALLAEHLFARGARRLMVVKMMLNRWSAVEERIRGIRSIAAARGGQVDIVGCGGGGVSEVQAAVDAAIESDGLPDAIMAITDQIGIAVLKLLKARGLKVPRDVLVTGFNGFEDWRLSDPMLTTVRSPGPELGQMAAREMIRRLETGSFSKRAIELPVKLVVGETT